MGVRRARTLPPRRFPHTLGAGGDALPGLPIVRLVQDAPGPASEGGNCDGVETCYVDADGDGFRPAASALTVAPSDTDCDDAGEALSLAALDDCDDGDPAVRPGATELAGDGVDQDCDDVDPALCHLDLDADGFGSIILLADADGSCTDAGQAPDGSDCDDGNAAVHPGASEATGDNLDSDCDGAEFCLIDLDSDGYRPLVSSAVLVSADSDCNDAGEGALSEPASDCDDSDPLRSPGRSETVADGFDSDCDNVESCFVDLDADGYRPSGSVIVPSSDLDCDEPGEGHTGTPTGDCDDGAALVNPGGRRDRRGRHRSELRRCGVVSE